MKKYLIGIKEVHVQTVEVEAEDVESALAEAERICEDGEDKMDEYPLEYSHTLDANTWSVDEI